MKADAEQAFRWYQKSAEQGYVAGQCFVGNCYEEGFGVEKNENLAKMWYAEAARSDPKQTAKILKTLRKQPLE